MTPVERTLVVVVCLASFGCRSERPASHGDHPGTCSITPEPLRAGALTRTRTRVAEVLDFPARGKDPAVHQEALEEREDSTTVVEASGAVAHRVNFEVSRHRLRMANGAMAPGPLDGLKAELVIVDGAVVVHPFAGKIDDRAQTTLLDLHRHLGEPDPFIALGPTSSAVGARNAPYEAVLARWMRRDRPDASGHVPEVRAMLTRCDAASATFSVSFRVIGHQLGWDLDGHLEGQLVLSRRHGRPTSVTLHTVATATAPDADGKGSVRGDQSVENVYE